MYDIIKAQMAATVPFAGYTGVVLETLSAGEATASLELRSEIANHIGSMHAGALFTLGETASGAAMSGAFAAQILTIRPIAFEANIKYLKIAKGRITASARTDTSAASLLETLEAENRVRFSVTVSMTNADGVEVATMAVGWQVNKG